jgi:hypothetical protein
LIPLKDCQGGIDHNEWWFPGNYAASLEQVDENLREHAANMSRISFFKGWFSKELFSSFAETGAFGSCYQVTKV